MFDASTLEERRTRRHLNQLQWEHVALRSRDHTALVLGHVGDIKGPFDSLPRDPSILVVALPQRLDSLPVLLAVLALVQSCILSRPLGGVWVITRRTSPTVHLAQPDHAGAWGLCRSVRSEAPLLAVRCADVGGAPKHAHLRRWQIDASLVLCGDHIEAEVATHGNSTLSPRLVTAKRVPQSQDGPPAAPRAASTHLLTGGTGGLGLLSAGWLADADRRSHLVQT
jgi:hypothetical protein